MAKRFTKVNESFACQNCGMQVPPAEKTCRNHCPNCLYSLHVDINPGDRANPCQGLMKPIGFEMSGKKGIVILYRCLKCGALGRNKAATEDGNMADNYELLIKLGTDVP